MGNIVYHQMRLRRQDINAFGEASGQIRVRFSVISIFLLLFCLSQKRMIFSEKIKKTLSSLNYFCRSQNFNCGSYVCSNKILMYHNITDAPITRFEVPVDSFAKQMRFLFKNKYEVIELAEAIKEIGGNQKERKVVITFDDGKREIYENALPILKNYGFKATVFLISDFLSDDRNNEYLTIAQIKKMQSCEISFGSHSCSHKKLTELPAAQSQKEIRDSKTKIEEITGSEIKFFSYPGGFFNENMERMVRDSGYAAACSTIMYGSNSIEDLYRLKRLWIIGNDSLSDFRMKLSGAYDWIAKIK